MADHRPADDESIPGDELLYIRIYPAPDAIVAVDGGFRPNTGSVKGRNKNEPVSIDLGSLCTPEQTQNRGTNGNFHVAMVTAASLRQHGLRVIRDPIVDGPVTNLAHALVIGSRINPTDGNQTGGLTESEYSKMARAARIIITTSPILLTQN